MALPLLLGTFLMFYFYNMLSDKDKTIMFDAFRNANYWWVLAGLFCGFLSHLSRSKRWLYMLNALGHKISFVNSYHAIMTGYIVNYALPRAGEASRAALVKKYCGVPFAKGFGTIVAERIIDLAMLGFIALTTLVLQAEKLDLFEQKIDAFRQSFQTTDSSGISIGNIIKWVLITGIVVMIVMVIVKPSVRNKTRNIAKELYHGLKVVFTLKERLAFIGHTLFIWIMYIAMFSLPFYSIEATSNLPFAAMLAGFVAGTIGIVLVQGGIGVYPAFVGLIITVYLSSGSEQLIHPDALALGWIIWTSQTVMMIVLGGVSLYLMPRVNRKKL